VAAIAWRLMVVTDRALAGGEERLLEIVEAAARAGGADVAVQVREKDLDRRALLALAARVRERIAPHGAALVVNGWPVADAGLQLPAGDVPPPADARRAFGRSAHSADEVRRALAQRASWVVFGPVWPTRDKPRATGVDALRAACVAAGATPVIAIGGIGPEQAREARAAGAHGVAVIRAVLAATDPAAATTALLAALH